MTKTIPLAALACALALSACSKQAEEPDTVTTASPAGDVAEASLASEPTQSEAVLEATATPTASTRDTVAANEIPAALRGRWGLVPKDCTSTLGDAKGLLTISAAQLKFYESVAKLSKVKESDSDRLRGTFNFSGEGQAWTLDVALQVEDGGKTLIRRDTGKDALPGPLKYTRCT